MKNIINLFLYPFRKLNDYRKLRKRIKELRKRDPFIYK